MLEKLKQIKNYPDIDHYVIGNDGVRRYYVEEGVLKHE